MSEDGSASGEGRADAPSVARALLESAINHSVRMDPEGLAILAPLRGKRMAVDVVGTGLRFILCFGEHGVQLEPIAAGGAGVSVAGTPMALLRAMFTSADELFGPEVSITGDVTEAQRVRSALRRLSVDWEEQLSVYLGDVVAHQLCNAASTAARYASSAADTLLRDLGEYLVEEARLVSARAELDAFMSAVDELRDDVERLGKRIARLQPPGMERRM